MGGGEEEGEYRCCEGCGDDPGIGYEGRVPVESWNGVTGLKCLWFPVPCVVCIGAELRIDLLICVGLRDWYLEVDDGGIARWTGAFGCLEEVRGTEFDGSVV